MNPEIYHGNLIATLGMLVAAAVDNGKLKGVQRPLLEPDTPRAYRVTTANGSLVLCDRHLDLLRARESAALTGEHFSTELCDHCNKERT